MSENQIRKEESTPAYFHNEITSGNEYPIYVSDDTTACLCVYENNNVLKVIDIKELIKDKKELNQWFYPDRYTAYSGTVKPIIFALKNIAGYKDVIHQFSESGLITFVQDLNFGIKPIISDDYEEIENQIQEQYKEHFSTASVIDDFLDIIGSRANTPPISTGFKQLDDVLGGGLHEGVISIGADTSLGKTTFCMQIADYIAKSGQDVLLFSLEMSKTELISKSISRITYEHCKSKNRPLKLAKTQLGITDGTRYKSYTTEELLLIRESINEYKQGIAQGLYIHESVADMTVKQIQGKIDTHYQMTRKYPVVIVDYLQLLQHEDKYINSQDKLRTDVNITALKRLSRDYKIPIIAISSFNRTNYNRDDISLAAFKESGAIEYSSDIAIGFKLISERDIPYTDLTERHIKLSVLKNRQGRRGIDIEYTYIPAFNAYTEIEDKEQTKRVIIR